MTLLRCLTPPDRKPAPNIQKIKNLRQIPLYQYIVDA
jgi:hypothetical protein